MISNHERTILHALHQISPQYGFQLLNVCEMPRGSIYTTLQRMERKGLVSSSKKPPNPIRFYRVTAKGRRALAAAKAHNRAMGVR